jgi:rhomboid domain-containing protein 1
MYRRGPGAFAYPTRGGYYNRRRDPYQDQQVIRLVLALVHQILMMEHKPPVTLALGALNVLAYLKPKGLSDILPRIPSTRSGCLQPAKILFGGEWGRLLWSPFLHSDDLHLYYNMASFLWKGAILEPFMGSLGFAALILELLLSTGLIYVGIASVAVSQGLWFSKRAFNSCAIGFSGVLFGLKVVLNAHSPGWSSIAGFNLPTKYAAWAELVLISIITPNSSFLGHLSGIFAGLLHVYVISKVIDKLKFEYRRNAARQQQQQRRNSSSNGTGASGSGIRGRTWGGS